MSVIKPILLSAFNTIQLYHYGDVADGQPARVYWQCSQYRQSYGPFPTIEAALADFTKNGHKRMFAIWAKPMVQLHRPTEDNVIFFDFKAKRRVV